jgi:hypothetical protein
VSSLAGPGALRSITGTTPGPAAFLNETVPTGARWDLLVVSYTLNTAVGGVPRLTALQIDDGLNVRSQTSAAFGQAAGQFIRFTWGGNLPVVLDPNNNIVTGPLPAPALLLAGHVFRVVGPPLAVGDVMSAPTYLVRELLEVP